MSVIIILVLASLAVALLFLAAFIWAVRSGQYEDLCTPSMRILAEEPLQAGTRSTGSVGVRDNVEVVPTKGRTGMSALPCEWPTGMSALRCTPKELKESNQP